MSVGSSKSGKASNAVADVEASIGLDDGEGVAITAAPRRDVDGVPYCAKHHCRMKMASGAGKTTGKDYYRCPVPECTERGVRIRTIREQIIPAQPLKCPRCSKDESIVYCEADLGRSTSVGVVLKCPHCGYSPGMFVRPQLEAERLSGAKRNEDVPGVGDR